MPITLPPISRRRFLQSTLAAAAGLLVAPRLGWSAPAGDADPNHLALLSDIHINADRAFVSKQGVTMWNNLKQASDEILALPSRPSMVLVNGDVAYSSGRANDYATVIEALKPMREAGLPIHLGLGNHDNRENIKSAISAEESCVKELTDRRVMRLELPAGDWYVLDSLDKTKSTPGVLGEGQLAWLKASLDARPDRAAVLMLHHQPDNRPLDKRSGLADTPEFLEAIQPRTQVKAVLFGHTHIWKHYETNGLHFVNLPTSAYVFDPKQPAGWVDATLSASSLKLQLHSLTSGHAADKEIRDLKWR